MRPTSLLITFFIALTLAIVAFCLWLSLKLFGLKTDRSTAIKVIGIEATFLSVINLAGSATSGALQALLSLLFLIGGLLLWVQLLKRFVPRNYSLGRAIGSFITGCIFTLIVLLVAAIIGVAFLAQVFKIDGDSMAPGLQANQTVLVYKFDTNPDNNSVVVYRTSRGVQALGRVHGVPGQSVAVTSGRVEVNGELKSVNSFTLRDNQYYVTTDNAAYNVPPRIITADAIVGSVGPKL